MVFKDISNLANEGQELEEIPVSINYDIIRLFSEGLYRSPHKAIEELVSNGYDAGARHVHVLLPDQPEDQSVDPAPLWVIDDGEGMDTDGFRRLWLVAESAKNAQTTGRRLPIGQFGIGKLAAYVIAWRLTHVSCVDGRFLLTVMDFRRVTGRQSGQADPVEVSLREISATTAREYLAEIQRRDSGAWDLMFGGHGRSSTWTAAALTEFKELYGQLSDGRLRWVLSTGLPLHTNFRIFLNGQRVTSSKENLAEIERFDIGETLAGIGEIEGTARIHEKQLTSGKSQQMGRSNGFFVRVRGRVINLEDGLFGVPPLNHAAWSRFSLEVDADGLRDYLLSSREGVRDAEPVQAFRRILQRAFNRCRSAYDEWERKQNEDMDIARLLSDQPSAHVTEPLLRSVRSTVESGSESFYIDAPPGADDQHRMEWLEAYESEVAERPFDQTKFVKQGPNAPALRYDSETRMLLVNSEHPFVDKLTGGGKNRNPAKLFASSEVLLEGQLQDQGVDRSAIANFLRDRDRVLRLAAGDAPPTASEVLRLLQVAVTDRTALERATGAAFQVLGFEYERRGGNAPGPDGVLYARLGRHGETLADYKLVYDAKQTRHQSVPADKVNLGSLEDFRNSADADFGFFIAVAYQGEGDETSKLNRQLGKEANNRLTLLKVEHLDRLVRLHYRHGLTLTKLRLLFEKVQTVGQADEWINSLEERLDQQSEVPLQVLLDGLEQEKSDPRAIPNVIAVRAKLPQLQEFEPERLIARLQAVASIVGAQWIEVERSGNVVLHQTTPQLLAEIERNVIDLADNEGED